MDRRRFLLSTSFAARAAAPPDDLDEATIDSLQQAQQSGRESAASLAGRYLARIGATDRQGPAVNAVIELNPDALATAAALDRERREKARAARSTAFPS